MYSYNVFQGQYEYLDGTIREDVPRNQPFYRMYSYNVLQGQYEYLDGTIREYVWQQQGKCTIITINKTLTE